MPLSGPQPEVYTLFCLIFGEDTPFSTEISKDKTVHDLKVAIKEKVANALANVVAHKLILYLVNLPDEDSLAENAIQRFNSEPPLKALRATHKLRKFYEATPPEETIHILVKVPDIGSTGVQRKESTGIDNSRVNLEESMLKKNRPCRFYPGAQIDNFIARRESTVTALYERLNLNRFILVRGTPASGQSTLAQLLAEYICIKEPTVNLIMIITWPNDGFGRSVKLNNAYDPNGPNTIIIDRAHTTYWDSETWNDLFKSISPESLDRVILFAKYGDPVRGISVEGTDMIVPYASRVSLRPVGYGDGIAPAGLFLTPDEFADMVEKLYPTGRFKVDFLDYVLRITAGHIGAVKDLLKVVRAHDSYRGLEHDDREYSLEIFKSQFPLDSFWWGLEQACIFRRGLPLPYQLEEPDFVRVFRAVLRNNFVTTQMLSTKDKEALDLCFKRGWLHATSVDECKPRYIFSTPLHQWFIEYYLGTKVPYAIRVTDQDLPAFTINVIRHFSHLRLSSPRDIGASDKLRPSEARFQDEFYRCCHEYSNGSLISFPEFESPSGRIELYIPLGEWGVELLRDGAELEDYSSRFIGEGAYANMKFKDHIILNFCTKRPQETHAEIPKLHHVIFENDYKHILILGGSSMETVAELELSD